ncbi:hypothetical protein KSF_108240 [Reticulibacter mediterranei]|uniref:Uncharacterized protein n=1 Tax=Reticulibacter mediterranei TaxID=2778369 RepID=A0A8J3J4X2_9CHLR|nr:hypothetical protein [Reticulibacter mediterranei]GHP00777.1 hypothetical protein KSF_108240 [Reticulibacter mediterranei]
MGTRAYYTIRQVRLLLGGGGGKLVDGKILSRWMREANIAPQQNPHDKREWRITRVQLEALAEVRAITLPADETMREDIEQAKSLSALTIEIEGLRQAVETLQTTLDHIPQTLTAALQSQLDQIMPQILARVSATGGQPSQGGEEATSPLSPPRRVSAAAHAPSNVQQESLEINRIEDVYQVGSLVALSDFERLHHVPHPNSYYHMQRKKDLPVLNVYWEREGKRPLTLALDEDGQAIFFQLFSQQKDFRRCAQCPHHVPEG